MYAPYSTVTVCILALIVSGGIAGFVLGRICSPWTWTPYPSDGIEPPTDAEIEAFLREPYDVERDGDL